MSTLTHTSLLKIQFRPENTVGVSKTIATRSDRPGEVLVETEALDPNAKDRFPNSMLFALCFSSNQYTTGKPRTSTRLRDDFSVHRVHNCRNGILRKQEKDDTIL